MISAVDDEVGRNMSTCEFQRADESLNDDLVCSLCHRLMEDPCQTACGCQFCYSCISTYISQDHLYCPGGKLECAEDPLNLQRDVFRNMRLATRISKVVVRCSHKSCIHKIELGHIREHMEVCNKRPKICPCSTIGCLERSGPEDEIKQHMVSHILPHSELMISVMMDMVKQMKEVKEHMETEFSLQREESRKKEEWYEKVKMEIDVILSDSRNKDNMIKVLDQEVNELRKEVQKMRLILEKDEETKEVVMVATRRTFDDTMTNLEWIEDMKGRINEVKRQVFEIRMKMEANEEDRDRRMNNLIRLNKLCPNMDVDFLWRVEEYSKKRRTVTDLYSDSFHSHGYKFCLNLYIYGDNLGLWCVLMKGDKDDFLEWPLRRTVTLSIVEQDSLRTHKSTFFQYDTYQRNKKAFDRPKDDRNDYCIGTDSLVRYSYIKDTPLLLVNDSIVVTCVIR